MKRKFNKLALVSFIFGLAGILTALTRAGGVPVLAIPLGIVAVLCSAGAHRIYSQETHFAPRHRFRCFGRMPRRGRHTVQRCVH